MKEYSSEYVTNSDYMVLNHAGIQQHHRDVCVERPNGRGDYHILYIYEGSCRVQMLNDSCLLGEGMMILFKPGEKQMYYFYKDDHTTSCYLHFSGKVCECLMDEIGFENTRIIEVGKSKTIFALFEKIAMESKLERPYSDGLCATYTLELLYLAGRRHAYKNDESMHKKQQKIDSALKLIHENYMKNITRYDCAKQCNLSVGRFSHLFSEITGRSMGEYLTDVRIIRAQELLSTTDYTVSEVSEQCGFSNPSYFARIFKKCTGMTPQQYGKHE